MPLSIIKQFRGIGDISGLGTLFKHPEGYAVNEPVVKIVIDTRQGFFQGCNDLPIKTGIFASIFSLFFSIYSKKSDFNWSSFSLMTASG